VATIPSGFNPFQPGAYISLTVLAVVLVSLVPDVLLGVSQSQPGTTWPGVVGLMVMHLAVAAVAVTSYARLLPLPARRAA
jgi:hypothetical protein